MRKSIDFAFATLMLVLFTLSGCKRTQGRGAQASKTPAPAGAVSLRIVHDPTLTPLLTRIKERFEGFNPVLSDGSRVRLELLERLGVQAADEISSGKLKVDAWLSPSQSLTNYAGYRIRNLGAKQIECREMFGSPVVVAAHPKAAAALGLASRQLDLEMLLSRGKEAVPALILNHSLPNESQTGFAALIELAYAAQADSGKVLTNASLTAPATVERLKRFEQLVAEYGVNTLELLEKSAAAPVYTMALTLTTEQQLVAFNLARPGKEPLLALYPKQGSYWLNYSLCRSDADWVTSERLAAYKLFTTYLASEQIQSEVLERGFRPSRVGSLSAPLTPENGVTPNLPDRLLMPLSGELVAQLLGLWPSVKRPAAAVLVLDTSGSMQGDTLRVVQGQAVNFIRSLPPADRAAVVTFSGNASVASGLTDDKARLTQLIEGLEAAGGSALYDAVNAAMQIFSQAQLPDYRKAMLLVVDGRDTNSMINLPLALSTLENTARQHHLQLVVVGIKSDEYDPAALKDMVEAVNGSYRETSREQLYEALQEALRGIA